MMHTKLTLIAVIFLSSAAVFALDCTNHPLKPVGVADDLWSNTSVEAPANMTFCKALVGKQICMTAKGMNATRVAFAAKKAAFMVKRRAKLAKFEAMSKEWAKSVKTMVDVAADMGAEMFSSAMLMVRMGMNTFKQWDCEFNSTGNFDGNCPGMPNVTTWFMAGKGKNVNKDVIKNMIKIIMAMEQAVNGTDIDPRNMNMTRRFLADDNSTSNMTMPDLGEWNATAAKWMSMMMLKNEKEMYNYLRQNPEMTREIPFKAIRLAARKMLKPEMKTMVMTYHAQKLAAFKTQRACFVRLMKVHTTMKCASLMAEVAFAQKDGNVTKIRVGRGAMTNATKICMKSVNDMIRLGEAWSESQVMMHMVSRYPAAKREWIKWKKMMIAVSKCDMKIETILKLVVYKIFETNGLFDQGNTFEKNELELVKKMITEKKPFEMSMKLPEGCGNETCPQVSAWFTPRGVSDDAADLNNFQVHNTSNVTLKDIDTNLDVFRKYEDAMKDEATEMNATMYAKMVMAVLEGDLTILEKLFNGTDPFAPKRRMLAEENLALEEVDDATGGALAAGEDDNLDASELADVDVEISQEQPTEQLDAVEAVNENQDTQVGDDSNTDDIDPTDNDTDKGTSFMTWVMYIGGAILVMALIAGACYLVMQRKDADDFTRRENTEMTEQPQQPAHHQHYNH